MSFTGTEPITVTDGVVRILDQTRLPHDVVHRCLETLEDAAEAIRTMQVRGAPLIGVTAAYGLALALRAESSDTRLAEAAELLIATRPTGVNLRRVVDAMCALVRNARPDERANLALCEAHRLRKEDIATNRAIGDHGIPLIEAIAGTKSDPVQVLTHCNAGALATAGYGTATSPIYRAMEVGIPLHVWVDETRPRNQGSALTAWELGQAGIPHTVIVDNAGGHLMQTGRVDLCLVGTDRTLASGDVCNKIGTYLKALAAYDNGVPYYVAVPGLSIDWESTDTATVPIEERDSQEVAEIAGVRLVPDGTPTANFGFDITPARLLTGLITERGLCPATEDGLRGLYPEFAK
jgi:methylthioribose-1-phosphate isomerase